MRQNPDLTRSGATVSTLRPKGPQSQPMKPKQGSACVEFTEISVFQTERLPGSVRVAQTFTRYPVLFVEHISQDTIGTLWLATPTGLYGLDPETGRILRFSHDPNDPSSLSGNGVRSTGQDKAGRFWL
jgi:ligand-binding sensor domain-containing protein